MPQVRVAAGKESTRIQNKIQINEWKFSIPETLSHNVHSLPVLQHLSASEHAAGIPCLLEVTLRANGSHLMSPRLNSLQPPQLPHTCTSNHRCHILSGPTKLMGTVPDTGPVTPECRTLALTQYTREQTTRSLGGFCCLPREIKLEGTCSESKEESWWGRFMLKNCEKVLRITFKQGLRCLINRNIK